METPTYTPFDFIKQGSIPQQRTHYNEPFPFTYEPSNNQKVNSIQLQEFMLKNHQNILKQTSYYGAVLFKGFDLVNAQEFASILQKLGLKEMEYVGGAAVRTLIVGSENRINNVQVFTSNESPPSQPIPFHHELAQTPNPPSHISFFCRLNAADGGSTPILRSDVVYDYLLENYPDFVKKIEETGVRYIKVAPEFDDPQSALGRGWTSMFGVKNKEEAEAKMKKDEWEWEWLENRDCKTISKVLPAVITSSNGKKSFFNQIIAAYTGWNDCRNNSKSAVVFGDQSGCMPEEVMINLEKFMYANSVPFQWKTGDFIIIDNTVAYHSRETFVGKRSVLATLSKGIKPVELQQTSITLKSGDIMPSVGLGLWKLPKETCSEVVFQVIYSNNIYQKALQTGYRLLDSACDYGNEILVGEGLTRALTSGTVSRDQVFVTSKLWNTHHRKEHVKEACLKSMKDLNVDYLDLYLIHFPIALKYVPISTRYPAEWLYDPNSPNPQMEEDNVPLSETWAAMEDLVKEGLVRNIGLCNFGTSQIRDLLTYCQIKPSVLQIELHPYNTQEKLIRFCRSKEIAVTGFSNLGASSYFELNMAQKNESVMTESIVEEIAKKYQKTMAQVVLRWGVQRGTAIIPKTSNAERLKENLDLFGFSLTNEEMENINNLNKNKRFNDPGVFCEGAFNSFFPIYE